MKKCTDMWLLGVRGERPRQCTMAALSPGHSLSSEDALRRPGRSVLTRPTTPQQREHPRHQQHLQSVSAVSVSRPQPSVWHGDNVVNKISSDYNLNKKWDGVAKLEFLKCHKNMKKCMSMYKLYIMALTFKHSAKFQKHRDIVFTKVAGWGCLLMLSVCNV